jgi:hypothetical protein
METMMIYRVETVHAMFGDHASLYDGSTGELLASGTPEHIEAMVTALTKANRRLAEITKGSKFGSER